MVPGNESTYRRVPPPRGPDHLGAVRKASVGGLQARAYTSAVETLDGPHTQAVTATKILAVGACQILTVEGNQKTLYWLPNALWWST